MEHAISRRKVLVGVDGSPANRPALLWALAEAEARQDELVATYAWHIPSFAYYSPGYVPIAADDMAEAGQKLLEGFVPPLAADKQVPVTLRSVEGPAHRALQHAAEAPDVELVVVGSRGHGAVANLILGSTSHALSHHCPKPLVIVPGRPDPTPSATHEIRHIVVGLDGSDGAVSALNWAAEEAKLHRATLELVVAWSWATIPRELIVDLAIDLSLEVAAKEILSKALERLHGQDLETKLTVREGSAPDVLLDVAQSADLLVVGTRGFGRTRETFLGSVSHQCVHRSPVPVVVVPTNV